MRQDRYSWQMVWMLEELCEGPASASRLQSRYDTNKYLSDPKYLERGWRLSEKMKCKRALHTLQSRGDVELYYDDTDYKAIPSSVDEMTYFVRFGGPQWLWARITDKGRSVLELPRVQRFTKEQMLKQFNESLTPEQREGLAKIFEPDQED